MAADGDELQEAGSERVLFEAGSGEEMSFTVSPSGEMVAIIVTAASRSPPSWLCSWLLIACPPLSSVDLHVTCLARHSALPRSPALHHPPIQTLLSRNPRPHPAPRTLPLHCHHVSSAGSRPPLSLLCACLPGVARPVLRPVDHVADAACMHHVCLPTCAASTSEPAWWQSTISSGPSLLHSSRSISLSRPRCTAVLLVWRAHLRCFNPSAARDRVEARPRQ